MGKAGWWYGTASVAALAVLAVGACNRERPPPPCPVPAIVGGVESASFGDAGLTEEPSRIVYRTAMPGFGGGCLYRRGDVLVRLTVDLTAVPGPAYDGRPLTVAYFVAVANPAGTVVDKQVFTARFPPPRDREAVSVQDRIEQVLAGVTEADGPGWKIYLGLDLPAAALLPR